MGTETETDVVVETEEELIVDEVVEEIEAEVEKEEWLKTEEDEVPASDDPSKHVPVGKFVALKKNLRGQISDKDRENEELRQRLAASEAQRQPPMGAELKRPDANDFEDNGAYQTALDNYYDKRAEETARRVRADDDARAQSEAGTRQLSEAVDSHYTRATELLETSGISEEVYQTADSTVRSAVDMLVPGAGDKIVDQLISVTGEGSEKVMYFLGRNPAALQKFQGLLQSDPSGMKAAIFLGQEKQRLTAPSKIRTSAPDPSPTANGDAPVNSNAGALKRKYDAAHKSGNIQAAYNIKKQARASKVNVAKW